MKVTRFAMILSFVIICAYGCAADVKHERQRYSEKKSLMGTIVQLDVCLDRNNAVDYQKAYIEVWERLEDIAWRMNVYDERSDVTKVNESFEQLVSIGADTYEMLQRSVDYAAQSKGVFLISVRPLIDLWYQAQQDNQSPDAEEIKRILKYISLTELDFMSGNRIQRNNQIIKLDLGGIAKGYAIDEAARIFRRHGLSNFFIDAGGDLYVGGTNCHGQKWRIGIRDPRDRSKVIETVAVTNMAVTTSGNYEQFFLIEGKKWSHIINPVTGYPQKEVVSATILAESAEVADVYSTALTVLGKQEGIQLVEQNGLLLAGLIFVKGENGRVIRSESQDFKKFRLIH